MLDTIVARATQLSGTEAGAIYVFDESDRQFQLRATYGMTADMIAVINEHHADFSEALRMATERREPDQIAALQPSSRANELVMQLGYRARLVVPLLAPDRIVGALVVRRKAPGEFAKTRSNSCRPSPRNRYWRSRMRDYSARSKTRAASSRKQASTSRNSSPT